MLQDFNGSSLDAAANVGALARRLAAIADQHRRQDLASPTQDPSVKAVLRGARFHAAPRRRRQASSAQLIRMAAACPGDLAGLRDRALLLLAAGGIARHALVGLDAEAVRHEGGGVTLTLRDRPDESPRTETLPHAADWTAAPAECRRQLAVSRVGCSRACPFDLHALLPMPAVILRLGPDHPRALAWLWQHWGTTQMLRHIAEGPAQPKRRAPAVGQAVWHLSLAAQLTELRSKLLLPVHAPEAVAARGQVEMLRRQLLDEQQAEAYRLPLPTPWPVHETIARACQRLALLPDGSPLSDYLPEIAGDDQRLLRGRAAMASTLIAGLELARDWSAQPGPGRLLAGDTGQAAGCRRRRRCGYESGCELPTVESAMPVQRP